MGVMKGTFTQPMPDGKGGSMAPTGKAFATNMCTVGIWNNQGRMDEEFLFCDNQIFYKRSVWPEPFGRLERFSHNKVQPLCGAPTAYCAGFSISVLKKIDTRIGEDPSY